jgi:hypothetical protein
LFFPTNQNTNERRQDPTMMTLRPRCTQTINNNASTTKRRWQRSQGEHAHLKKHHYDDNHLSCRSFALLVTPLNTKMSWRGARSWQWRPHKPRTIMQAQPKEGNEGGHVHLKRRLWWWW